MLISVWHHGHLGSNPFLGEVEIALDCYDLECPQEECMALMTKVKHLNYFNNHHFITGSLLSLFVFLFYFFMVGVYGYKIRFDI